MSFALTEMRRRPQRFVTATIILTLITVLLVFLGGLIDGLVAGSTNALTAQPGQLVVFSSDAQDTLARSRITGEERAAVAATDGVAAVGGLSVTSLGARLGDPASRDLLDVSVFGYELPPRGVPGAPPPGQVWADATLEADGVATGTELLVGPARTRLTVAGFVNDTEYAGGASLWASPATWRDVTTANRPDVAVAGDVTQSLVVEAGPGVDPAPLAGAIDAATGGATHTLTIAGAVDAIPGVAQQRSTFTQIIGVTVVVALVVVALFFALIVVERTALYGVLKAMGARRGALVGGVLAQAVAVSLIASAIGAGLAAALAAALPAGSIPFTLSAGRVASSVVLVLVASVLGCLTSLRRVLRIDPASAIGSAS